MWHKWLPKHRTVFFLTRQPVFFILKLLVGWILPRWLHCSPAPFHSTASVPSVLEEGSGFQAKGAAGGCQAGVLAMCTQSVSALNPSQPPSLGSAGGSWGTARASWDQCPQCFGRCIHRESPAETKDFPVPCRCNKKICSFLLVF